jgi:hypothetical protein
VTARSSATSRAFLPSAASRDAGRTRVGALTLWLAAGGVAGVGVFGGLAAAKSSTPRANTLPSPTEDVVDGRDPRGDSGEGSGDEAPATLPPTLPAQAVTGLPQTTATPHIIQPPAAPPSSGRHHRDAVTSGGS